MVDDIVACGAARYAGGGVRMSNGFGVGVSYEGCHWYGIWCKYIPVGHSSYRHALCECLMLWCSTGEEHCGYPMRRHGAVKWNLRAIGWYIGESSIT